MSTLLERPRRTAADDDGRAPRAPRIAPSAQPSHARRPKTHHPLASVPLWVGRVLQAIAATMVLVAVTDVVLPEGIYWATSYFAVFGFSPEPVLFNAVLLFVVGAASKRRLRGALVFLVLFELPTVLLPLTNLLEAVREGSVLPTDIQRVDVVAAVLAAAFVVLLLVARGQYSAVLPRSTYVRAAAVFLGGVAVAVLTGGVLARMTAGPGESAADSWWWALYSATGVFPSSTLVEVQATGLHQSIETVVSSISAVALLIALAMLLRSARARQLLTEGEELELRGILASNRTDDALAYFATRRDKSAVFSPSRRSAVSYRVVGAVALASGDPVGPEEEWDAAIDEWLRVVDHFGWRPAVLAASERAAHHYQRRGMRGMVLGDEAVLRLNGPHAEAVTRSPQVASARRRARRAGYTAQFRRQRDIPHAELIALADLAEDWRHGAEERGFSMALSRFADPSDGDALVATAHDGDGVVKALLVFVPWNGDGVSLDVMRRHPESVNGATEFLVSELVAQAPALGLTRVSLNFAVLRDVFVRGARVGAGPLLRAKRRMLLMLSRHWQLDSLRRANEKYDPDWRPRLLMWSRRTTIASVVLAVARAEGFARSPHRWHVQSAPRSADFAAAVRALGTPVIGLPPVHPVSPSTARRIGIAEGIRASGGDPFPPRVARTAALSEVRRDIESAGSTAVPLEPVSVVGRVLGRRRHGGITFLDIVEDHVGLQVIAAAGRTRGYGALRGIDLGDLISVSGAPVRSVRGEPSIAADSWEVAAKSLRQPPNRRTGLRDPEVQVRQRQVHLATSPDAAELIRARARATRALRDCLLAEDYLEVETPVLQRTHGGATARPFRTHINAYDRELTLRIAPELALKRLIVAGFPRVFEIGRNFRNEGVDATHNPEFTAMEAYRAFADYDDMRRLAERLIRSALVAVSGSATMLLPSGERIDVSAPWRVVAVCDALTDCIGIPIRPDHDPEALRDVCAVYGVSVAGGAGVGTMIESLYEELVEPRTVEPTFYTDFPAETSPLARPHRRIPGLAERWDLVAGGMELGTAYTELNDPVEQRRRLTEQSLRAAHGDPEAMQLDEEFLAALEFGMPPTGGLGLGVDRIVMVATGATIRQTLAFPFVR
ncbi:bifunctional lysylphosphatidylglycerol synthetase/lysine--tRNA ligase LysX [Microbacterium sp. F1-18]